MSSSSNQLPNSRSRLLAHGAKFIRTAVAPAPEVPYDVDPLPDEETASLYESTNAVGSPLGRTPLSAATPPAAVRGQERGNANFTFDLPLLSLPGRAGLNVNLSLVYNSRLWNKSTISTTTGGVTTEKTHMTYDADNGWPVAGFRLGYGQLEFQSFGYTLISPDGTRHELFLVGLSSSNPKIYETRDGSSISYNGDTHIVTYPNGTQALFGASGGSGVRSYPIQITDRNGNFIIRRELKVVWPDVSMSNSRKGSNAIRSESVWQKEEKLSL